MWVHVSKEIIIKRLQYIFQPLHTWITWLHLIQEFTVSEKGTGAEMRPAVVAWIVTGNAPVSYWLMFCVSWVLQLPSGFINVQGVRAWPVVYRPYRRRRKSLNLGRCHSNGSSFSPVSSCTRSFRKCRDPPCVHKHNCPRIESFITCSRVRECKTLLYLHAVYSSSFSLV